MIMKLIALLLLPISIAFCQEVKLSDGNIMLNIKTVNINDSLIQYKGIVKNIGNDYVFIYHSDSTNESYLTNFIGIGLFSHLEPYLPISVTKYNEIQLIQIVPNSQVEYSGIFKRGKTNELTISLDYYFPNSKKNKQRAVNDIVVVGSTYEKYMKRLKVTVLLN